MAQNSKIEWTNHTFNPWIGCTKVSEGCKNCYAERDFDKRRHVVEWGPGKPRHRTVASNWRKPRIWNAKAERTGERPRVFCASIADWLDPEVPLEWLADLLALIFETPNLDWLLLTKRPELWRDRMRFAALDAADRELHKRYSAICNWLEGIAPPNVWIGATVENQKNTTRIPNLLQIPALVRFLSCEPLIGAVDLGKVELVPDVFDGDKLKRCGIRINPLAGQFFESQLFDNERKIHWVITGGESGPPARPMHPDWVRDIRDQCQKAGVAYLHKQWGEWAPGECAQDAPTKTERTATWINDAWSFGALTVKASEEMHCDDQPDLYWLGKARAGRMLDGVIHNEFPKVRV